MSIRLQQLFLLLGIALLPVLLSGWQSLRQIDHMPQQLWIDKLEPDGAEQQQHKEDNPSALREEVGFEEVEMHSVGEWVS